MLEALHPAGQSFRFHLPNTSKIRDFINQKGKPGRDPGDESEAVQIDEEEQSDQVPQDEEPRESFWSKYKRWIIGGAAAVGIVGGTVAAFGAKRRKALEAEEESLGAPRSRAARKRSAPLLLWKIPAEPATLKGGKQAAKKAGKKKPKSNSKAGKYQTSLS